MTEEEKVIPMEEVEAMKGAEATRERTILAAPRRAFSGFLDFIRERGVMGLLSASSSGPRCSGSLPRSSTTS